MKKALLVYLIVFSCIVGLAQPANDICTNATVVPINGTCVSGTTVNSTDNWQGSVACQGGGTHPDVWYTFVATGSQAQFAITTSAPWTGNVELILVQGTCAGGFSLVGNQCGASPMSATFTGLGIGNTYYYTISNTNNGTPGPFQTCVTISNPPPLAGQDCNNAAIICNSNPFSQPTSNAGYSVPLDQWLPYLRYRRRQTTL